MDADIRQTSLAPAPSRSEVVPSTGRAGLAAAAGMLGALASMSCCILPVALFTLGISGAWIGNLTALAPYQPIFLAARAVKLPIQAPLMPSVNKATGRMQQDIEASAPSIPPAAANPALPMDGATSLRLGAAARLVCVVSASMVCSSY